MPHKHHHEQRPDETSRSIREQLERETQALLNERNSIQIHKPSTTNIPLTQNRFDGFSNVSPRTRWAG